MAMKRPPLICQKSASSYSGRISASVPATTGESPPWRAACAATTISTRRTGADESGSAKYCGVNEASSYGPGGKVPNRANSRPSTSTLKLLPMRGTNSACGTLGSLTGTSNAKAASPSTAPCRWSQL